MQSERTGLLSEDPRVAVDSLDHLLGLANAVEVEAVSRYAQLAELMDQRGEGETAKVFREMCAIEKGHVDMVARRATSLGRRLPPPAEFTWRLPPELGASWDEVRHSALLTPYRALALAVTNEERAFALYSYIAAAADDDEVAREAETLAREELSHAAELRVLRRRAYHRAFPAERPAAVESLADFQNLDGHLARRAAEVLTAIAASLDAAGDGESAEQLRHLARREEAAVAGAPAGKGYTPQANRPGPLLQEALCPLEAASEHYEHLVDQAASEEVLRAAQDALHRVVEAISALGRRREEIEARAGGQS